MKYFFFKNLKNIHILQNFEIFKKIHKVLKIKEQNEFLISYKYTNQTYRLFFQEIIVLKRFLRFSL